MKPFRIPALAAAALCLTACGQVTAPYAPASPSSPSGGTAPVAETKPSATERTTESAPASLPVLAIETVSTEADVMDFVTKPVSRHVAESIASWTPGYVIPPEPYYEDCIVTLTDADTTVLLGASEAKVKVRGNWTTSYDKKPLRIKFSEKQSMAGLHDGEAFKNWVLLASYKDASLLRDKAALSFSRELLGADGLYAADAQLVEVTINGEYWGVYLLTEQQQVSPRRIAVNDPEKGYTGTDIGYFLEFDGYFYTEDPLHQFHVDYADNAPLTPYDGKGGSGRTMRFLPNAEEPYKTDVGFTIKSEINDKAQRDFIADYVNNVYRIMYAAAYEKTAYRFTEDYRSIEIAPELSPQEAVEAVVNVESLADLYIISEMVCDADLYFSSFFMTADFSAEGNKKLTFQAPWDFDSGMGNKARCENGKGFYAANIMPDVNGNAFETVNPWLTVIMYEDWYQEIIRDKWTAAYDKGVFDRSLRMVRENNARFQEAFLRNTERWGICTKDRSVTNELSRSALKCKTQQDAADFLASWLEQRIAFMNEQWHR